MIKESSQFKTFLGIDDQFPELRDPGHDSTTTMSQSLFEKERTLSPGDSKNNGAPVLLEEEGQFDTMAQAQATSKFGQTQ